MGPGSGSRWATGGAKEGFFDDELVAEELIRGQVGAPRSAQEAPRRGRIILHRLSQPLPDGVDG